MLAIAENSNEFVEDMKESKKTLATTLHIYRGARPTLHITYIKVKKEKLHFIYGPKYKGR